MNILQDIVPWEFLIIGLCFARIILIFIEATKYDRPKKQALIEWWADNMALGVVIICIMKGLVWVLLKLMDIWL